ncbi:MAG: VOC family protein [Gammaproteobacteria bacterium]|nr:VOC family protein [Gammaproteobacteria bacterium]
MSKTKNLLISFLTPFGMLIAISMTNACAHSVSTVGNGSTQHPSVDIDNHDPSKEEPMAHSVTPFLMFQGKNAQEAIDFYLDVIPGSRIEDVQHYGDSNPEFADLIMFATVSIGGQDVRFSDSPIKHAFDFTPSFSFLIECESEEQLKAIASQLEESGKVLMPIDSYGFSKKFTWVEDRFGVSWQLVYW